MIPRLILLIGIPGSGKSSWLKCQRLDDFEIISPDQIRQEEFGDISTQANNIEVWYKAKVKTFDALNEGRSVILDATNVNTKYRLEFIAGLPTCKLQAKIFRDGPQECYERISRDLQAGRNRSNVPEETVFRMYGELLYTIKVIQSEGFEIILGVEMEMGYLKTREDFGIFFKKLNFKKGAEVGVQQGNFSRIIRENWFGGGRN